MRKKKEERKVCCLCCCLTGISQKDLRQLPDGSFAEQGCINEKIHREIIQPIKNVIPDIYHPPFSNPPEIILKSLVAGLLTQPLYLAQDFLFRVLDFSENFLGKNIALSRFLR